MVFSKKKSDKRGQKIRLSRALRSHVLLMVTIHRSTGRLLLGSGRTAGRRLCTASAALAGLGGWTKVISGV